MGKKLETFELLFNEKQDFKIILTDNPQVEWVKLKEITMADITMCKGNYCELSNTCYRYKAEPSEYRQSYFVKEPNVTSYQCDYYWEVCIRHDNLSRSNF
jgi:hypothetical protein